MSMGIRPRSWVAAGFAAAVAAFAFPAGASAACPGIPETPGTYIDFADGSVKFRGLFAQRGLAVASNGKAIPRAFRGAGTGTAYFELHLESLVGLPGSPKAAAGIVSKADALFTKAADSTACATPLIALDEFEGGSSAGPFTGKAATYRANVLTLMTRLRDRGARVFLLIPGGFSTSERGAASFWRQAAAVSELIPEVYLNARTLHTSGPVNGNRTLRVAYRNALLQLAALGIPAQRLGLFIGFQSQLGNGGREGLKPAGAWMRVVKWQTLSADTVSRELRIGTVWSWGWGTFSSAGADADKPTAACVYLWTRNPALCPQALERAGAGFDPSLREGRLRVPGNSHCAWKGGGRISAGDILRLEPVIGGRARALTALLEGTLARRAPGVKPRLIDAAERELVKGHFGGDRSAYLAALAQRGLTKRLTRVLIADQVARREVERRRKKRAQSFAQWLSAAQTSALTTMTCRRDEVPAKGEVNASKRLSFLKLPREKN